MNYYFYKLIPPRPTYAQDMTSSEAAAMGSHFEYWRELVAEGDVIVYGPVDDPVGTFGMAVVRAGDEGEVRAIGTADPAVVSGGCSVEVFAMPATIVSPALTD